MSSNKYSASSIRQKISIFEFFLQSGSGWLFFATWILQKFFPKFTFLEHFRRIKKKLEKLFIFSSSSKGSSSSTFHNFAADLTEEISKKRFVKFTAFEYYVYWFLFEETFFFTFCKTRIYITFLETVKSH